MPIKEIITPKDRSDLNHPFYGSLVNNLCLFDQEYTVPILRSFPKYEDNSNIEKFPSFEEIIENYDIDNPPSPDEIFICRIKDEYIYTSDKDQYDSVSESCGYDRIRDQSRYDRHPKHTEKLNTPDPRRPKESKGFRIQDAGILAAYIRVKKIDGKYKFTVVKTEGGGRFVTKKIANRGAPVEFLFRIFFHLVDDDGALLDTIEASGHYTDCEKRASQTESQKYASGVMTKEEIYTYCEKFLMECELDFDNRMNAKLKDKKVSLWPSLTSLSHLNKGENKGQFDKNKKDGTGRECALWGFKTLRKVGMEICKPSENELPTTAGRVFATMFHSFCLNHNPTRSKLPPPFDFKSMQKFIIDICEHEYEIFKAELAEGSGKFSPKNKKSKKNISFLSRFSQSGTISLEYIAAKVFWKKHQGESMIKTWYKNEMGIDKAFGLGNPYVQNFIGKIKDDDTKKLVERIVQ